jgi:hypothetical protein
MALDRPDHHRTPSTRRISLTRRPSPDNQDPGEPATQRRGTTLHITIPNIREQRPPDQPTSRKIEASGRTISVS